MCFARWPGWPKFDTYREFDTNPVKIAEAPAMARLPQALLSHPNGAALAVFAHVDEAHVYVGQEGATQLDGFRSIMERVMAGKRFGHASDLVDPDACAVS